MVKRNRVLCLLATGILLTGLLSACDTAPAGNSEENNTESEVASTLVEEIEVPELEGYSLLWHDEFSGDTLDETIWNYEPHAPGWTNNELQEYTTSTDNVFIKDGNLNIKAIKNVDANGKDYYTSGKVTAQNKKDFTYGKVVARAKVPEGKGLWPAIWMMPQDENHYGQWPKCGEIDIMEVLGDNTTTAYGTIHYGEPHGEQQGVYNLTGTTFAEDFHEYSVEWEPGEMRFYIDGNLYHTVNDWFTAVDGQPEKPYPAPFDQPFFVQMNLAVGGNWPGDPDQNTDFDKAVLEVDYVRVYQKAQYDTNVTKPEKQFRSALEDGNLIYNADFAEAEDLADDVNWKFLLFQGGEGAAEIKNNSIIITSQNEGTVDYSVQLVQPELPMINGKKYRITFDAMASEDRNIIVCISAPTNGWVRYFPDTKQAITTEMQTYTFDFEMTQKDDNNGRLEFNMGHLGSTATITIANVRVEEVTE